ncbi:MAG: hypothetical protein KTR29_22875 [Rhodothermaceae bacterium]|nr:hypothetical protein [Rhodothermaceae bacterium]
MMHLPTISTSNRSQNGTFGAYRYTSVVLFITTLALSLDVSAQDNPFIAQNDLVVVQAESIDLTGDWVTESGDAGFTGSGYIRWNGADFFGTPGNGIVAIPFTVTSSGNYWFKLRSSHTGAPAGDQWNDTWIRVNDGGTWLKAGHPAANMDDGFTFDMFVEPSGGAFIDPLFYLDAGTHVFYLSGRSFNYRIDRIHIYKDGTPDPENLSHPESPRENGGGGGGGGGGGVYELTVNGGTGSGSYPSGTQVVVSAPEISNGIPFDRWTGATQYIDDIFSTQTFVTQPAANVSITATYKSQVLRDPEDPVNSLPQASYEYYIQTVDFLPNFDTLTPTTTGTSPTISLAPSTIADGFLFRYSGYIDAPTDGTYTFYTASDDGSQMFIGDLMVVDNDSIQSVQERSGEIGLKAGKHAFTVTYFERTGDEALTVSWAGPGISKQEIPASALYHGGEITDAVPPGDVSLNGTVSALDASMILSHTIGQVPLEGKGLGAADVSGDGGVSAYDASLVLQYVVGILPCFPAEAGCAGKAPTSVGARFYNLSDR